MPRFWKETPLKPGRYPSVTQRKSEIRLPREVRQERVAAAARFDEVVGAERPPDPLLPPAREVDGEGDPEEPAVPPEVMIGVHVVPPPSRKTPGERGSSAPGTCLAMARRPPPASPAS